jgi:hypothetical protein
LDTAQPISRAAFVPPKVETRAFVARNFAPLCVNSCNAATLDGLLQIKIVFIRRDRLYFVFRKLKMFLLSETPVCNRLRAGKIWTN